MSDQRPPTLEPDFPEAVVARRSRLLPELIWVIPIVAALIGGWLALKAIRSHGPTITISFKDAGGWRPARPSSGTGTSTWARSGPSASAPIARRS